MRAVQFSGATHKYACAPKYTRSPSPNAKRSRRALNSSKELASAGYSALNFSSSNL